jgi:hypothetical protein
VTAASGTTATVTKRATPIVLTIALRRHASILLTAFAATLYVSHLFDSYATRCRVIGAVFAMISTLFCIVVIIVGSAALGSEISDELARIRRGERPPDHEVRRQWDMMTVEARSRCAPRFIPDGGFRARQRWRDSTT